MADSAPPEPEPESAGTRVCAQCGRQIGGTVDRCPQDGGPLVSAEAMARVGTRLKDYEIRRAIGSGATGVVYQAQLIGKSRPVVIKVLHDHWARQKGLVEQLVAEVKAATRIGHPNIIHVSDLGITTDGTAYLAMEYLDGESLADRLRQVHRLPLFEAINVVRQVAHALGAAHEAGLVHRDLKPGNIFLSQREGHRRVVRRSKRAGMRLVVEPEQSFDLVTVLDFGVGKLLDGASAPAQAGAARGSPHYLSPEQAQQGAVDQRSDIYALGAIFYEMVTGTVPFGGESLSDILRAHALGTVIAPSRRTPGAGLDLHIDALILRCLKKNPPLRFATTAQLCAALDACPTDCAFLRDAHRLPGIKDSGIDLSEASPAARQDPARARKKLPPTAGADGPAARPAASPVARKPAPPPVAQQPATAPAEASSTVVAPAKANATATPDATKPTVAPAAALARVAPVVEEPVAAPVAEAAAPTPVVGESPAVAAAAMAAPVPPMAEDPAAAVPTPPPEIIAPVDDPAAGMITPPPEIVAPAEDPAAALLTPPPSRVAADLPTRRATEATDEPGWRTVERPEATVADVDLKEDAPPGRRGRTTPRRGGATARAGLLLLLLGAVAIAFWAAGDGWGPFLAFSSAPEPPPVPAPAVARVAEPAVPAAPAAVPAAPSAAEPAAAVAPKPEPVAPAAVPAAPSVAEPAAAVAPKPEPVAPAGTAKAASRGPGKVTSSRARPARTSSARRTAAALPEPFTTAPASAAAAAGPVVAEPESTPAAVAKPNPPPTSEAPPTAKANAEPELPPPAPPNAEDYLREAQQAWLRGHYAAAIDKAEAALKAEPKRGQAMQAYEIIGTCSCAIGQVDAAREAASHLSDTKREAVNAVCTKHGLTIE